jgi:hypothetical protein
MHPRTSLKVILPVQVFALLALATALTAFAQIAHAQGKGAGPDADYQLRLYVMAYTAGKIDKSPADPNGNFASHDFEANGATLELIFFGRVGASISQQFDGRTFNNTVGQKVREDWSNTYYSLTAYARPAGRHRANAFVGYGNGTIDRYTEKLNGVTTSPYDPAKDLPLTRLFAGVEYAGERMGIRAEYAQLDSNSKVQGQSSKFSQTLQVLSLFIPFN